MAYVLTHWEDILAAITLIMTALVGLAHGLVWLSDVLFRLALMTSSTADDDAARKLMALAARLARGADWLASQHARIMPRKERPAHADSPTL